MSWYAYCIVEQLRLLNYRARRIFPLPGMSGIGGAQVLSQWGFCGDRHRGAAGWRGRHESPI